MQLSFASFEIKPTNAKGVSLVREAECLSNTIYSVTRRGRRDPPLGNGGPSFVFHDLGKRVIARGALECATVVSGFVRHTTCCAAYVPLLTNADIPFAPPNVYFAGNAEYSSDSARIISV